MSFERWELATTRDERDESRGGQRGVPNVDHYWVTLEARRALRVTVSPQRPGKIALPVAVPKWLDVRPVYGTFCPIGADPTASECPLAYLVTRHNSNGKRCEARGRSHIATGVTDVEADLGYCVHVVSSGGDVDRRGRAGIG
jgi:hypothetical protein